MLGGMAAEALIFHDVTSGAGNDIEKATGLARAMVTQYGMTERLGAVKLGESNSEPFLGRDMGHQRDYSEDVAALVDEEVKGFISYAHQEAFDILVENRDVLDALVVALMDKETLDKEEVAEVFASLRRRPVRPAWTGSPDRVPSTIPPVAYQPSRNEQEREKERQESEAPVTVPPDAVGPTSRPDTVPPGVVPGPGDVPPPRPFDLPPGGGPGTPGPGDPNGGPRP
jgi:cell division protease FtsH